jgi:heat shock protein HslJ
MARFRLLALGTLLLAAITGCTSIGTRMSTTNADTTAAPPLENTAWVLAALPGLALVPAAPATLRFESGRAVGSDGCNRFSIGYSAQDGKLDFPSPGAGTRMACPPEVMKQADVFLLAVSGAKGYRIAGGQLQLLGADGAVRASFEPQSTTLAGTRWRATTINNGRGAVQGVATGSTVTLAFDDKNRFSGSAGCNRFAGSYTSSGGTLKLSPAATTRMACADERLAEQEDAFLKALASVSALGMEADRLELRTASGALAAGFTRDKN